MRGDLAKLLSDATRDEVDYVFGDSIKSLAQDSDGVTAVFRSGDTGRFDLVIGADGLHSNVRRLAFRPESDFLDYKGYYFAFGNTDAALGVNRTITMFNTPGEDGRDLPLGSGLPGAGAGRALSRRRVRRTCGPPGRPTGAAGGTGAHAARPQSAPQRAGRRRDAPRRLINKA